MTTSKSIDILAPHHQVRLVQPTAERPVSKPFRRRIPRYVKVVLMTFVLINTVSLILQGVGLAMALFSTAAAPRTTVILALLAILGFAPALLAAFSLQRIKSLRIARSRYQFWGEPALYFVGGIIAPWLALILVAAVIGIVLRVLSLSVS